MADFYTIQLDAESELLYAPYFLSSSLSTNYFKNLLNEIDWRAEKIKIFGKEFWQPRLIAWYGDLKATYSYSGILHQPQAWTPQLLELKNLIEVASGTVFNSVLANQYRNGQDSMGWHSDNEKELGLYPVIASLSLGSQRRFRLKSRKDGARKNIDLPNGSLLIMRGATQENWLHQIAKTKKEVGARINLTFRWVYPNS